MPKFLPEIVFVIPKLSFKKNNFKVKKFVLGALALVVIGFFVYEIDDKLKIKDDLKQFVEDKPQPPAEPEKIAPVHETPIYKDDMLIDLEIIRPVRVNLLAERFKNISNRSYIQARNHYNNNDFANAAKYYKEVIEHSGLSQDDLVMVFNSYQKLGDIYYKLQNYDKSAYYYSFAIKFDIEKTNDIIKNLHYNLGRALERSGNIDEAIKEYEKAIQLDNKFANPYTALFNIYMNIRNLREARNIALLGQNNLDKKAEMLYNLALVRIKEQQNYELALQALKNAWEEVKDDRLNDYFKVKVLTQIASLYQRENDNLNVIKYLEKAEKIMPTNIPILENLAHAYSNNQNYEKALVRYENLTKLDRSAYQYPLLAGTMLLKMNENQKANSYFQTARRIVEADENLTEPYFLDYYLAKVYLEAGMEGTAFNYFIQAIESGKNVSIPELNEDVNRTLYNSYISIAPILRTNNHLEHAVEAYKNALKLQEQHFIYYNLGIIKEEKGNIDKAIENYRMAISRDNRNFDYNKTLGSLLFRLARYVESERYINTAYNINPNDYEVAFMKGYNYYYDGDLRNAQDYFKRVINLNPSQNILAITFKNIGNIYNINNEPDTAIPYYLSSIKIFPEDGILYYNTGLAYMKLNNNSEALYYFKIAENLLQDNPSSQVLASIGDVYFETGLPAKAADYYRKALQYDPNNIEITYNLKITEDILSIK